MKRNYVNLFFVKRLKVIQIFFLQMSQESDKISHCYYVIYIEGLIAKLHTSGFSQKIVQLNITPANFHKS